MRASNVLPLETSGTAFESRLIEYILSNLDNSFQDHLDFYLTGQHRPSLLKQLAKRALPASVRRFVRHPIRTLMPEPADPQTVVDNWRELTAHMPGLIRTYELLHDEYSKQLFIQVLAFRVLGAGRVKLPLNTPRLQKDFDFIHGLADQDDFIDVGFLGWKLTKVDCSALGAPIRLYSNAMGLHAVFLAKQYECPTVPEIRVHEGDTVIDAGGCWGDTALLFAHQAGPRGKVVCAEFVPANLEIMRKNLGLNPELSRRITILESPLWSEPGVETFISGNGPATRVQFERPAEPCESVKTMSIDRMREEKGLERIDFIKMDIEGSELPALRGAVATLKRDRPRLAISVYHSLHDLARIPEFIANLGLGYQMHLGHFTIGAGETVLFAATRA